MIAIKDRPNYIESMRKSIDQKLFFMDKLDPDFLLDFGCADGTLVETAMFMKPKLIAVGYDHDHEMIKTVQQNGKGQYTSELKIALQHAKKARGVRILLLSSVLHEIYSACGHDEIRALWKSIQEVGFDYIVIRDMLYDENYKQVTTIELLDLTKFEPDPLTEFESIWGPTSIRKNFVHFLLKYRYKENWDREVKENYLSLNRNVLLETLKLLGYEFEYWEHHSLDFIKQTVYDDICIRLEDKTHIKAIFKRK